MMEYSRMILSSLFLCAVHVYVVCSDWSCPVGWNKYSLSCYHFSQEHTSWFDAMKMCQIHGGHLVHVEEAAEDRFIVSLMDKNNCSIVWLGASDWTIEGIWVWEPHGDRLNYTHFDVGRPNNLGTENCLLIDGSSHSHHSYKWDDRGCEKQYCYVCELMNVNVGSLLG
ncbi:perlucin-like protein [Ostrea edulis]|uniref:perlucin-like protein n=1 Tax=Ostrea edulis TaxID=37623 RepID=UPI0024AF7924|nr:perlucin-like protein [Ostrea edulis]